VRSFFRHAAAVRTVDYRYLQGAPGRRNPRFQPATISGAIDDILQVLPKTRQVLVVIGSGEIGKFWRRQLEAGFARFRSRDVYLSGDLSLQEVLDRCAHLPDNSAILI
jgi:hypothetical protein